MNHEYSHCLDYEPNCPKKCFRAQLTKELLDNPTVVPMGIASWTHFRNLDECEKNRKKVKSDG